MSKPRSSTPTKDPSRRMSLRHVPSLVHLIRGPSSSGSSDERPQGALRSRRQSLSRGTASSLAKTAPLAKDQPESFLPRPRHHSLNHLLPKRRSSLATPLPSSTPLRTSHGASPPPPMPIPSQSKQKRPGHRHHLPTPTHRHPQRAWPAFGLLPNKRDEKTPGSGPMPNTLPMKLHPKQRGGRDAVPAHCLEAYSHSETTTPTAVAPRVASRRSSLADLSRRAALFTRRSSQPSLNVLPCHVDESHTHHAHSLDHPPSTTSHEYGFMRRTKCAACSSKGRSRRRSLSQSHSAFESGTCASPPLKHAVSSDGGNTVPRTDRQPPASKMPSILLEERTTIKDDAPASPTTPEPTLQHQSAGPSPELDPNAHAMAVAVRLVKEAASRGTPPAPISPEQHERLVASSERLEALSRHLLGSGERVSELLKSHLAMTPAGYEERAKACESLVETQQQVLSEMKVLFAACSPATPTHITERPMTEEEDEDEGTSTVTLSTTLEASSLPDRPWQKSVDKSMTRMRWSLSRFLGGPVSSGQVVAKDDLDGDLTLIIAGMGVTMEAALVPEHARSSTAAPVLFHHYTLRLRREDREKYGLLPLSAWVRDQAVARCEFELDGPCTAAFDWLQRRHHCRRCGHLFCNTHSANRLPLFASADGPAQWSRVCDTCFFSLVGPHLQPN